MPNFDSKNIYAQNDPETNLTLIIPAIATRSSPIISPADNNSLAIPSAESWIIIH